MHDEPIGPKFFRIGDKVRLTYPFGRPIQFKRVHTVTDVDMNPSTRCQSGLMLKIDSYPDWLDWGWFYHAD